MNTKHESWHFQGLILFTSSNLYILTSLILVSTVIIMFCIKFKFKLPPKKLNTLKQRNKMDDKELDNGIIHLKRNSGQTCVNTKTESWNQTPDKSSPNSPLPNLPQSSVANSPQIPTTSSPVLPLPSLPINQYPSQEHYQQQHYCHPANHPYSHSSYETIVNGNISSRRTQGKQKLPPYQTHPMPFTNWLIKITQKLLHWKNDFVNRTPFNVSTQFNCQCKPMNDNKCISHDNNSTPMQRKMNNNNVVDKGQLNEDRILFDSLQIKRKANSMKEETGRKQTASPFWMNNTNHHIVQSYSTIIIPSSHPTTNCRPSPYRQLDSSQSDDLLDPIYSVIQYPLNTGALQSTQSLSPSSGCDYSEGSMNQRQFIEPHRLLLAKDIWTSQDSVVSNDHVYCELIKLQTDKNSINHQSDKIMHKRHNSTHHSTCSLRSSSEYNKYHISDGYSDLCSSQSTGMKPTRQPPRLPTRNYGESTLNMVANVRLWTLQSKQRCLRNIKRISKLHKHVQSMLDMTWRLDEIKNYQEFRFHKINNSVNNSNTSRKSSLRIPYRCRKHFYAKQPYHEQHLISYQGILQKLSTTKTRSVRSESDAVISLENYNSSGNRGSLSRGEKYHVKQMTSGCYSNEAFYSELDVQSSSGKSSTVNDLFSNLRHIDSEVDITEQSPCRTKPTGTIQSPSRQIYNSYLMNHSCTPLHHIYIPNSYNKPVEFHMERRYDNHYEKSMSPYHKSTDKTCTDLSANYNTFSLVASVPFPGTTVYSSLGMPPLMERSMEDDECQLFR